MSLTARLRAYHPDGDTAGFLTESTSWSASLPVNDVSAMRLSYPSAAKHADLLGGPCEVAVEINDGTGWVEPRNARYRRVEQGGNRAQGDADVPSYTMPGYASLLDGVRVIPASYGNPNNYDTDGKRKFLSASVGQILATVLQEARGLVAGLVPGLSLAFSPTTDAAGVTWSRQVTIYYEPGTSLLTILDNLAGQGQCDWWMQGRVLHVVNPDSTSTTTSVRILSPATEEPVRSSLAGLLHTAFLVGEEQTWRIDNPGTPTPWGTSMKVLTQGGVRDEGTATQLIQAELQAGSAERIEYTRTVPVDGSEAQDLPLVAYQLGDYVQARNKAGGWEQMRVHQVTLSFDGTLSAALTLNDRFIDAEVRNAKRTRGIVNGASGDAGSGNLPERPRRAKPARPEGLVTSSQGYWKDGLAKSSVQAGWAPVQVDTNGYAISISHYVLRVDGRTVQTAATSAGVDDLGPGQVVEVILAAVSMDGIYSDWAYTTQPTLPPLERLDPPTAFSLSAEYGIVTAEWDGQLQGSGQPYDPPTHFSGVRVQEATTPDGPYATVGVIIGGAIVLDRQSVLGETLWYRGVAYDRMGDDSEPGPSTSVVVRSIISEEIDQARHDAASAVQQAADALAAAGEAVTESVVEYAVGASETTPPTTGWSTATPTRTPGTFIWVRTVITYGDDSTSTTSPALLTGNTGADGADGTDGADGISVTAITTYYTLWDSENAPAPPAPTTNPPPATWTTTEPGYTPGLDLYRVELVTYSDDTWSYTPVQKSSAYQAAIHVGNLADAATKGLIRSGAEEPPHYEGRLWLEQDATGSTIGIKRSNGSIWQSYALMAEQILVPGSVGEVAIANGAIRAPKVVFDEGFADEFWANQANFGKVTTQMFSTNAAFEGSGVHIDRTGVAVTAFNNSSWHYLDINATDGFRLRRGGNTTFQADMSGNVMIQNGLLVGGTITGPLFQTTATGDRGLKIDSTGMRGYDSAGNLTFQYVAGSGNVTMAGDFMLRANDFPNVEIRRNTWADFTGIRWNYTSGQGGNVPEIKVNHTTWGSWWGGSIFITGPERNNTARPEIVAGYHGTFGANVYQNITNQSNQELAYTRMSAGAHRFGNSAGAYIFSGMTAGSTSFKVNMTSDWALRYEGSMRALKTDIAPLIPDDPYDVLKLAPVVYRDREEVAKYGDAAEYEYGLIAEDVAALATDHIDLTPLLQHMGCHGLTGIAYDRLPILLLTLLKDLTARLDRLEEGANP